MTAVTQLGYLGQDHGHFAQAFGQYCVDEGHTIGTAGSDITLFFPQKLRKRGLCPLIPPIPP